MGQLKTIAKNSASLFVSQILSYLLIFFYILYVARYLGAEGFGILSLAISLTGIFGILVDMGLSTLMIREVARDKSKTNKFISNTALMKIILSFLVWVLLYLFVNVAGYPELVKNVVYLVYLSVLINAFSLIFTAVMQAEEKMEYVSLSAILNSVVMLSGTLMGIYYSLDILYFAALYVISNSLNFLYLSLVYLWKFNFPKIEVDFGFWKPTLKEAWPYGFTGLSGLLYTYVDSIMLSLIQGNLVVGWYSAAYRLMLITLFIPNAVNMAIFPLMSRLYVSSKDSLILINERYFKYMLILGIPLGFGTTILADKIILLVFGADFAPSVIVLQILIWTAVFTFAGATFSQLIQSINKQLLLTKISVMCLLINVVLNLILIPRYSYIGASIVTVLTEMILVSYMYYATFKLGYLIDTQKIIKNLGKITFSALIMSSFLLYFQYLNFFLLVILAALIYFLVIYLTETFDKMDEQLFRQLMRK
ncbi:MAG: flippase [Methanobacteriaceae archaeon]|nr:flippase [Methanobacteriaceae archaeon]